MLRAFVARCSDRPAVGLQIAELIGTAEEKRAAREQVRRVIDNRSGPAAAQAFYQGSVLRTTLWDCLIASAPDLDAANRILLARSRLDRKSSTGGAITLDLSALDPRDYCNISITELEEKLRTEFDDIPKAHMIKGMTPPLEIPTDVGRKMTEQSMEEVRTAINSYLQFLQRAVPGDVMGGNELSNKVLNYAERNVANAFEFAQKLVQVKDVQELVKLHTEFIQSQMQTMTEQAKYLSETTTKAMMDSAKTATKGVLSS